jgi:hypothetical protein
MTVAHLVQIILPFMEAKFITMFTKAHHADTLIIKTGASIQKQNIPIHLFNTTVLTTYYTWQYTLYNVYKHLNWSN